MIRGVVDNFPNTPVSSPVSKFQPDQVTPSAMHLARKCKRKKITAGAIAQRVEGAIAAKKNRKEKTKSKQLHLSAGGCPPQLERLNQGGPKIMSTP